MTMKEPRWKTGKQMKWQTNQIASCLSRAPSFALIDQRYSPFSTWSFSAAIWRRSFAAPRGLFSFFAKLLHLFYDFCWSSTWICLLIITWDYFQNRNFKHLNMAVSTDEDGSEFLNGFSNYTSVDDLYGKTDDDQWIQRCFGRHGERVRKNFRDHLSAHFIKKCSETGENSFDNFK